MRELSQGDREHQRPPAGGARGDARREALAEGEVLAEGVPCCLGEVEEEVSILELGEVRLEVYGWLAWWGEKGVRIDKAMDDQLRSLLLLVLLLWDE